MSNEQLKEKLRLFRSLKSDEIEEARQQATDKVLDKIGEEPQVEDYLKRIGEKPNPDDYSAGSMWARIKPHITVMDPLMIPILVALLLISLAHMLIMVGNLANESYHTFDNDFVGIWFSQWVWVLLHQLGMFFIAEPGVLFFYSSYNVKRAIYERDGGTYSKTGYIRFAQKYLKMDFILAVSLALIVVAANVSGLLYTTDTENIMLGRILLGGSLGLLIPAITLHLGERWSEIALASSELSERLREQLKEDLEQYEAERRLANDEYTKDRKAYFDVLEDPETFYVTDKKCYDHYFGEAILAIYKKMSIRTDRTSDSGRPVYAQYKDWTPNLEWAVVARELTRMKRLNSYVNADKQFLDFFTDKSEGEVSE